MKITPETKIKDIIPEGYEYEDCNMLKWANTDNYSGIDIRLKKKQQKDFEWYKNEYYEKAWEENYTKYQFGQLIKENCSRSFEAKIGLLRFICDDVFKDSFCPSLAYIIDILNDIRFGRLKRPGFNSTKKILEICPKEYLTNLFE